MTLYNIYIRFIITHLGVFLPVNRLRIGLFIRLSPLLSRVFISAILLLPSLHVIKVMLVCIAAVFRCVTRPDKPRGAL